MIKRSFIMILVLISVLIAKTGTVLASQQPPTPANLLAIERRQERQWWRYGMQAALKLPTPIPTTPAMKQAYQAGMKAMLTWQTEQPCPVGGWPAWLANLPDQRLAELMAQAELPIIITPQPSQPVTAAAGQPIQSARPVKHQIESPRLLTSAPLKNQIPVVNRPMACGEVEAAEPVTEHLVNPTDNQSSVAPSNHKSTLPRLTAPLNKNQQRFINHLKGPAQQIGRRYDLYPSVLIAQAALESNWGASDLAAHYHNYFGIKGTYQGHGVQLPTLEHYQGHDVGIIDQFKHYPDLTSGLVDYAMVLDNPIYQRVHRRQSSTYQQATKALTGVYATDPDYDLKLNQLIDSYHLDRFDRSPAAKPIKNQLSTKEASAASKTAERASAAPNQGTWRWSILGGISSAGLWVLAKRFW